MNIPALAAATLLTTSLFGLPATATTGLALPPSTETVTAQTPMKRLAGRHIDAPEISLVDGKLKLGITIHDTHGFEEHAADEAYMHLDKVVMYDRDISKLTIPDNDFGDKLKFIAKRGETVWYAPQNNIASSYQPLWVGFASHLNKSQVAEGTLRLSLTDVDGPGAMEAFVMNPRTKTVRRYFSSQDESVRTLKLPTHVHGHCGWAFTQPGTYRLTFQAEGTTPEGKRLVSEEQTFTWQVGPGTPE